MPTNIVDANGIGCFVDANGVTCFVDDQGNTLCCGISAVPGHGKSRREHTTGGAIYKIVNTPGP